MVRAGITCGDPNGIGPEVILKALSREEVYEIATFKLFISPDVFKFWKERLKNEVADLKYRTSRTDTRPPRKNKPEPFTVEIVPSGLKNFTPHPGDNNPYGALYALDTLKKAINALRNNVIDILITGPWAKSKIMRKDFDFQGVTDYLARASGVDDYLMFMISDELKVGFLTEHIPVDAVPSSITRDLIVSRVKIMVESLKCDFLVSRPVIALCAIHPHAGDEGKISNDDDTLKAAVEELKSEGIEIYGPFPSDGFWGTGMWRKFSAIMVPYHDQGMIPFKMITGMGGVNFTAGLPVVRTAPAHGPAFDIAGEGVADPTGMINAIYYGVKIYENRKEVMKWHSNPLKHHALQREE